MTTPVNVTAHADATDGLRAVADEYRRLLTDDILAWWLRHAIDRACGGVLSCIADDGRVLSDDKYVWSQVRALWTFSAACRRIRQDDAWRAVADQVFAFVADHGRNADGDWLFRLSRDGSQVLDGPDSIQTDAFAICALVEYALLSGNARAMDLARQSYRRSLAKLRAPGSYKTRPYPIPPGLKAQRVSMQFSLAYHDLARATGDADVYEQAMALTDDVLDHFRRPELKLTLEYLSLDNSIPPAPYGTYVSPGHGVETAWFQLENLRGRDEPTRRRKALDILQWSLEQGWDDQYGGLRYAFDRLGGEPLLPHGDAKLWWPQCEAICGTLIGYACCGENWCLQWHDRVAAWALAHYPTPHGEWTQRLDRTGRPMTDVVALPVKDPFHLPRALIYAIEAAERAVSTTETRR